MAIHPISHNCIGLDGSAVGGESFSLNNPVGDNKQPPSSQACQILHSQVNCEIEEIILYDNINVSYNSIFNNSIESRVEEQSLSITPVIFACGNSSCHRARGRK